MSGLQHERITALCERLKFARLHAEWPALAQEAARQEASFADFLEKALAAEALGRDERRATTLLRMATMPALKTLEQFDWSQASGAPKAQIQELAHLAFIERYVFRPPVVAAEGSPIGGAASRWFRSQPALAAAGLAVRCRRERHERPDAGTATGRALAAGRSRGP